MYSKAHRFEVLDGLRGIAAIAVMLYHYTTGDSRPLFQHAPLAVDMFFMLSGFVILHSYGDRLANGLMPGKDYTARRVIRLYPMFFLSLLIGLAGAAYAGGAYLDVTGWPEIVASFFTNAAMLPYLTLNADYKSVFPLNGSLWSLFFEMVASLAFILLCRFSTRGLAILAASCFAVTCAWAVFIYVYDGVGVFVAYPGWSVRDFGAGFARAIFGFSLGMLIYRLMPWMAKSDALMRISSAPVTAALTFIGFLALLSVHYEFKGLYNIAAMITVIPLLIVIGANATIKSSAALKACVFLGWISYPLYCLHMPLGHLSKYIFEQDFGIKFNAFAPVSITAIAVILLAGLSSRYLEEPLRDWLTGLRTNRHLARGASAPQPAK